MNNVVVLEVRQPPCFAAEVSPEIAPGHELALILF